MFTHRHLLLVLVYTINLAVQKRFFNYMQTFKNFNVMKSTFLSVFILLMVWSGVKAQVSYSFSTATGSYVALTNGITPTLISPFAGVFGPADEGYANNVSIGFNFVYNGVNYSAVNLNVNGFMTLGAGFVDNPDEDYFENNLTSGAVSLTGIRPVIAPLWDDMDLVNESNLKYELTGIAPNRVFTVEWSRARWIFSATSAGISFQAKLYEGSNIIDFIYRREAGNARSASASIGITSQLVGSGNFLSVSGSTNAAAVSSTTETADISLRPSTNQVFRFTPLSCIAPSQTTLTNRSGNSVTFSWNAVAGVSQYEYAVSTSILPPASGTLTTATSVQITTLSTTSNNFLYVRSVCGEGVTSAWSRRAIVLCTSNVAPIQGAITGKTVNISWNAVPNATGYTVMFSLTGIDFFNLGTLNGSVTAADISPLNYNTTYYFYIRPIIGADTASVACASNATSFTVSDPPVIPCVTNVAPTNGATNVSPAAAVISWNAVPGATEYAVLLSVDGGTSFETIFFTAQTSVNLGGNGLIDYSSTYNFYIRAIVDGDTSATTCRSGATSFTTIAKPPPPPNDNCQNAITLTTALINGTTLGATQSFEAEICNQFSGNANDDVWFKFSATSNGSVTINVNNVAVGLDPVLQVYIGSCSEFANIGCADDAFDAEGETFTIQNAVAGQTYYFRVYGFFEEVDGGTFSVRLTGAALPLTLTSFTGQHSTGKNLLNWQTSFEQNSRGFELERSANGIAFSALAFIQSKAANGVSNETLLYNFTDNKPFKGSSFYRLKMLDRDGSFKYSQVVVLKGTRPTVLQLSAVYPNPVQSVLNLLVTSPANNMVTFLISDLSGKVVMQQRANLISGDNPVRLQVGRLAAGSYLLKAVCNSGCQTSVQPFVKQ